MTSPNMTADQVRAIFDKEIAGTDDADRIARLEICREYFTNPPFRRALEDFAWAHVSKTTGESNAKG